MTAEIQTVTFVAETHRPLIRRVVHALCWPLRDKVVHYAVISDADGRTKRVTLQEGREVAAKLGSRVLYLHKKDSDPI